MPALSPIIFRTIFERALAEEIGVIVPTNNPDYLSQRLYSFRSKLGTEDMKEIAIIKLADRLVLAKKSVELDA